MKLTDLSSNRDEIFALYGKEVKNIDIDLQILREWMRKQQHIPSDSIGDDFLTINLLKNKFSIEKTKSKIESYVTFKAASRFHYLLEKVPVPSEEPMFCVPLEKLTTDYKRIFITRLRNENTYDMARDVSGIVIMQEFLSRFDYNDGLIFIIDLSRASMGVMTKFRANVLSDALTIMFDAFSSRIKEVHLINKYAAMIFNVVKPFIPQKIVSRVHLHDDFKTLRESFSLENLPKDFGGDRASYEELLGNWDDIFRTNKDDLDKYIKIKAREELRLKECKVDEMRGTFKRLNID